MTLPVWKPRVMMLSGNNPAAATSFTIGGAAETGYQSFVGAGYANGDLVKYWAVAVDANKVPTGLWEHGLGTIDTVANPDEVDRPASVLANSAGTTAKIDFSGATNVMLFVEAGVAEVDTLNYAVCNGRLTTETAVPVSTSDRTAQGTIYFTPYLGGQIGLYDGTAWAVYPFTEKSLALSALTSGKNYDVFIYNNAGVLTLELSAAWTNDTTRADALALQDGVYVKASATTRRHLGTIRTTGTTTTEDSAGGSTTQVGGKRFVWNRYNQVPRHLAVIDTTDTWSYTTNTTRQKNAAAGNKVEYVTGDAATLVIAQNLAGAFVSSNTSNAGKAGVGVDSITAFSGLVPGLYNQDVLGNTGGTPAGGYFWVTGLYKGYPGLGYHYLAALEKGALGTCTWIGDNAADDQLGGLQAWVMA